jgi:hypothetical protein
MSTSLVTTLRAAILRHRFLVLAAFTVTAGLIAMWVGAHKRSEFLGDVGNALFTAGTIGLAVEYYTRREFESLVMDRFQEVVDGSTLNTHLTHVAHLLELSRPIADRGLRHIHPSREGINFQSVIEDAESSSDIRVLGVCLSDFANRDMAKMIRDKINQGCRLKMLILNPNSSFAREHAAGESQLYSTSTYREMCISNDWHVNFHDRMSGEGHTKFELGHYEAAPHLLLVCTSNKVIVGFYLRGARGEDFPHIEFENRPGGLCGPFIRHFDALWNTRIEAHTTGLIV